MAGDAAWVPVQVGGKTRKLCYDLNAMCELEDRLGLTWDKVMEEVAAEKAGAKVIRTLVTVGLLRYWPEVTEAEVGAALTSTNMARMAEAVTKAISVGQPDAQREADRPVEGRVAEDPLGSPKANTEPALPEPSLVSTSA